MKTYKDQQIQVDTGQGVIRGVLHAPDRDAIGTALIVPGYFSATKSGPTRMFVDMARHLQGIGFIVLRFDYRGMGDSDGESGETSFESALADIAAMVQYLKGNAPTLSSAVIAHSMGCNCAVTAIVREALAVDRLVLIAPDTSGATTQEPLFTAEQIQRLRNGESIYRRGVLCGPEFLAPIFDKQIFEDASGIASPCLLVHGESDELYSKEDLRILASRLRGPTAFCGIVGGDHNFLDHEARTALIMQIGNWLRPRGEESSP